MRNLAKEAELNYFAFEAQMRKSLRELIDPYINKQTLDREQTAEVRRQIVALSKRVNDLEHTVLRGQDMHTVFDEYDRRFGETEARITLIRRGMEDEKKQQLKRNEEMDVQLSGFDKTLNLYVSAILFHLC
jgi:hypothetical protein